ncbi:hypothetical protein NQ314_008972 [Rhamnusium bicolor]|uniref:RING-type domain-containing protein n=1 Tax=Rhamnusium bicolor TaxID=1586634 RepID=A0AAV8Y3Z4_9CUCU|nr:hypothetical protein NQ314_008972 [Rhamnusium bicolor]
MSTVTVPNNKISKFNTREHCSDCLLKTCQVVYHKYYENNKEFCNTDVYDIMGVRVDTMSVLNVLGSDDLIMTITVIGRGTIVNHEATLNRNEQIRKSWECQICQEYLITPIYLCPTGHSLCGTCKSKLTNCPYCILVIGDSRNFTLEEISETVEINCQYEGKGCNFFGNIERIAKHEPKCAWKKWDEVPKKKQKLTL